jgi:hypothetical protein
MRLIVSQRGQFFSPDLVIALGVFIFGLVLFWSASNSVFGQTDLFSQRNEMDEVAHSILNQLVFSPGEPANWTRVSFSDINAFGLASSPNILDRNKVITLINYLNDSPNYSSVKERLGFGRFDIKLSIIGSDGNTLFDGNSLSGGIIAEDSKAELTYQRLVYYNSEQVILQSTVSLTGVVNPEYDGE